MALYGPLALLDSVLFQVRLYRDPQRIRMEVADLLSKPHVAAVAPQMRPFARAGGASQQLLCLQGTIPIYYQNVQYNIPIIIWIVEAYPFVSPFLYITPTSDMCITPRHKHVDSAGMVYHPYLSNWNPVTCSLVGLVTTLSQVFSMEPPVRSQSTPPSRNPPPPEYSSPTSSLAAPSFSKPLPPIPPTASQQYQTNPQNQPSMATPPPPYPSWASLPAYPPPPEYKGPPQVTEDPEVVLKRNALASITEKLQIKLREFYESRTKEVDQLMAESSVLHNPLLDAEQETLLREIQQAEQETKQLSDKLQGVTSWLEVNENAESQPNLDDLTDPKDPLSKQLLYLVAEDATIEDMLYYLDKALSVGYIDTETYMKHVRLLCREQFFHRATIKKVHEMQKQRTISRN